MIQKKQLPLKNFILWSLLIVIAILLLYFIFIALVSINVGLSHIHQDGFWMPITAGIVVIISCVCFFLFSLRFALNKLKEKEVIRI
ncbi:MAG: hypothetical protein JW882_11535 [Deltaproteobacteria bacterium]|nr:hypothetical protein [Deltaproteobacteria bacterium]